MIRVVLIDDEAIILEGLKKVVDWSGFGCEVVATAQTAQSGAEMIRRHEPQAADRVYRHQDAGSGRADHARGAQE